MESELADILRRGANNVWQLGLTEAQLAQYARYADLLVEWNATRLNLTRLTSPADIAVKHFLDSLALLTVLPFPSQASVIDIGTGAGLPGLALKIARPDLRLTLLDSTAKKLAFCRAVSDDLGLEDVRTLHARAEDAGRDPAHAQAYDFAVARAVAPLEKLLPWLAPFLRPGGVLAALKGVNVTEELPAARSIARRLHLTPRPLRCLSLPASGEPLARMLVLYDRKQSESETI